MQRDPFTGHVMSHPTRVRGLKLSHLARRTTGQTGSHPTRVRGLKLTTCRTTLPMLSSHPTRVSGLKRPCEDGTFVVLPVAPHAGAWIETIPCPTTCTVTRASHPTRVRGLKLVVDDLADAGLESHPTRVRGLKQVRLPAVRKGAAVAPHAGAWIETRSRPRPAHSPRRRTPRGCVD